MKEFRVHLFRYLSLVEILWSENVRNDIKFLTDKYELNKLFSSLLNSETRKEKINIGLFIHQQGPLKWAINKDGMIYLRTLQHLICENQPFRPLIPLSTPARRCVEVEEISDLVYNATKSISIYPQLICEVKISFSIKMEKPEKIDEIIREARRLFFKNEVRETEVILKSLFIEVPNLSIRMSDVYILLESTIDTFEKTNYIKDLSEAKRLSRLWIKKVEKNKWLLIYGNPQPHLKQRLRTLKVFQVYNFLYILRNRVQHLINRRIDEEIGLFQKIMLIEFILTTLNFDYYSSPDSPTYFFPKSYQRVLFSEINQIIGQEGAFAKLLDDLRKAFYSWDDFTQTVLIKENNIPLNFLKKGLTFIKNNEKRPSLTKKEKLMLDFFIDLYKKEDIGFTNKKATYIQYKHYLKYKKIHGLSLNKVREQLIEWQNKGEKISLEKDEKFTVSQLRAVPKELQRLVEEGLIIAEKQEKTRTKYTYFLNLAHPYVKELLL